MQDKAFTALTVTKHWPKKAISDSRYATPNNIKDGKMKKFSSI